ncbi:MAG: hypothetical protein KZQ79_01170, partial [Candidatus Thiodiazotropha sp. (ex Lucinoma borealis)]|nr:hypothetical protein [Candidatus Thiodiazotropha sp. (ex Lucinoma borealis)]
FCQIRLHTRERANRPQGCKEEHIDGNLLLSSVTAANGLPPLSHQASPIRRAVIRDKVENSKAALCKRLLVP